MPPVVRLNDLGSGHGRCLETKVITASTNSFINSRGIHRKDDELESHCNHDRLTADGSHNIYTNSKPTVRLGDPIKCGGVLVSGSENTFFN